MSETTDQQTPDPALTDEICEAIYTTAFLAPNAHMLWLCATLLDNLLTVDPQPHDPEPILKTFDKLSQLSMDQGYPDAVTTQIISFKLQKQQQIEDRKAAKANAAAHLN